MINTRLIFYSLFSFQDNDTISKISLSEIESHSEIENLNAKQLKIILTRNLVEYKGCKEKHELISRVKMLWESRKANQLLYEKLLNPQGKWASCKLPMPSPSLVLGASCSRWKLEWRGIEECRVMWYGI